MNWKLIASAVCVGGLTWIAAPTAASATGPAAPLAQNAREASPLDEMLQLSHYRRCRWHRHRGHGYHWPRRHRHCRHHGGWGGPGIIITF